MARQLRAYEKNGYARCGHCGQIKKDAEVSWYGGKNYCDSCIDDPHVAVIAQVREILYLSRTEGKSALEGPKKAAEFLGVVRDILMAGGGKH